MPELPEVETVRRTLEPLLVARTIQRVRLLRRDVVRGPSTARALLAGRPIGAILRHGKQLAIAAEPNGTGEGGLDGGPPCFCVHLGMSGSLRLFERGRGALPEHSHVVWQLEGQKQLVFTDPRRFGGVWTFAHTETLEHRRWSRLGPDALLIQPRQLHRRLGQPRRAIKAALLDQQLIAGLGNIYVDELLFTLGLHPLLAANALSLVELQKLIKHLRLLLRRAIAGGGSTFRDYVDGTGKTGRFQKSHRVYGRAGQPCLRCGKMLQQTIVAGRSTVFCRRCQVRIRKPTPRHTHRSRTHVG